MLAIVDVSSLSAATSRVKLQDGMRVTERYPSTIFILAKNEGRLVGVMVLGQNSLSSKRYSDLTDTLRDSAKLSLAQL